MSYDEFIAKLQSKHDLTFKHLGGRWWSVKHRTSLVIGKGEENRIVFGVLKTSALAKSDLFTCNPYKARNNKIYDQVEMPNYQAAELFFEFIVNGYIDLHP